jgi:hypothetical protein
VHDEEQPDSEFRRIYWDASRMPSELLPRTPASFRAFNTGQLVVTGGTLAREEFDSLVEWTRPRRLLHPHAFKSGEQGILNYVVCRRELEGTLTLGRARFMKWHAHEMDGVQLDAIRARASEPGLIHWAGLKQRTLGAMRRSDILRFFERQYYGRIPGGAARLQLRAGAEYAHRAARAVRRRLLPNAPTKRSATP